MKQYVLLLTILLLILPVAAENITANESYIIVTYDNSTNISANNVTPEPLPLPIGRRIDQGACVVPGETIDIAGNGWYTGGISYYGRWYDGYSIGGNSSVVASYSIEARDLDKVFLSPAFFSGKLGWWYTYYDTESRAGNDRLFYVAESCNPVAKENETTAKKEMNTLLLMKMAVSNITTLPIKTDGTDLIISKGSDFTTSAQNGTTRWVFGTFGTPAFYDTHIKSNATTYNKSLLQTIPAGSYNAITIRAGANGVIEEIYNPASKEIYSPFRALPNVSTHGIQSKLVEEILISRIKASHDDTYTLQKISLQDPYIEIKKLDQMTLVNNVTTLTVVGYTNANVNTSLKLIFDANQTTARTIAGNTHYAYVTDNGGDGAYRIWYTSFPIDLSEMPAGFHSITALNQEGAYTVIPFYIRSELPEHYKPDVHLKFIDNSPFVPTPTPEVIIKKEVITEKVIVTVTIPVTPSQESVDQAQWNAITGWVIIGVIVIIVGAVALYLIIAFFRGTRRR